MYQPYMDIIEKLGPPLWHDENGVPRYQEFEPRLSADIYANYVALLEIKCQSCGKLFPVAASWGITEAIGRMDLSNVVWDSTGHNPTPAAGLPVKGNAGAFGYGDAPWHDGNSQCSGTTMSIYIVRVLQFWRCDYDKKLDWTRLSEHEVHIGEEEMEASS